MKLEKDSDQVKAIIDSLKRSEKVKTEEPFRSYF